MNSALRQPSFSDYVSNGDVRMAIKQLLYGFDILRGSDDCESTNVGAFSIDFRPDEIHESN